MPFIYEPTSWSAHSTSPSTTLPALHTTLQSHAPLHAAKRNTNTSPTSSKMPSLNIFRRKSSKHESTMSTTPFERSLKGLSLETPGTNPTSSLFSTAAPSQATRRPANLPSIHNPFSHSNNPLSSSGAGTMAAHSSEPPPAYTPAAPQAAPATDNPYAFLTTFDTVFLIDDSGSMAGSRWTETERALEAITPICTAHDTNGIDIHFLNTPDSPTYTNVTSTERVNEIFSRVRPGGGTPTGSRLNALLKPYLRLCEAKGAARIEEVKPLNIIVITDGEAGDDPESVILSAARKLDKLDAPAWQLGIQFFQVGSDKEATKALRDLDDGLVDRGCGRDMVDTVPWRGQDGATGLNADGILKVVLGAVNRRLDRKRNSCEWRPSDRPS